MKRAGWGMPNGSPDFSTADHVESGGIGFLPNDRPHVLKLHGSYETDFGLTGGTFFTWQSGTPMSERASHPWLGFYPVSEVRANE